METEIADVKWPKALFDNTEPRQPGLHLGEVIKNKNYKLEPGNHEHPRADSRGRVPYHLKVTEKIYGKPIPKGRPVHHIDCNPFNNKPENLVLCESPAYHSLLHRRMRAFLAVGVPNARKCTICGGWDIPEKDYMVSLGTAEASFVHVICRRIRTRKWKSRNPDRVKIYNAKRNR